MAVGFIPTNEASKHEDRVRVRIDGFCSKCKYSSEKSKFEFVNYWLSSFILYVLTICLLNKFSRDLVNIHRDVVEDRCDKSICPERLL